MCKPSSVPKSAPVVVVVVVAGGGGCGGLVVCVVEKNVSLSKMLKGLIQPCE